jgi:hypothetical protein
MDVAMLVRFAALGLLLLAAACTPVPVPDTATVPPLAFGTNEDPDLAAVNLSSWALALPSRTHNDPVDAARAIAGVDYMAGQLYSDPLYAGVSPLTKQQMLDARVEVRRAIGVGPGASSQLVVNGLLAFANDTNAGDPAAAQAALSAPVFTLGPRATYDRLVALPFLREANIATMHLNGSFSGHSRG